MVWLYVLFACIGILVGWILRTILTVTRFNAVGTLNIVHFEGKNDELLLQLDDDPSKLGKDPYVTFRVRHSR